MTDAGRRRLLFASVNLATIMQVIDTTIANVALPYMQGSMSTTEDQIAWVLTSYIVASAIMMPATGFLARRFGRRNLMLMSLVGFSITSIMCGMAQSLEQIVFFRILQGISGAVISPLTQAILLDIYPLSQRGKVMAIWGVSVTVGPIIGPALGGLITEFYNWRWIFYINLPLSLIAIAGISASLKTGDIDSEKKLDWQGFLFLALSLGSMQLMLDRGNFKDWFASTEIWVEAILSAVCFYLFIAHSLTAKRPFVDLRLFMDRNYSLSIVFMFLLGFVLYAVMAMMAPFLQHLLGYPSLTAGVLMAPRGFGTMISMLLAGFLVNRFNPKMIMLAGALISTFALWEMSKFDLNVTTSMIIWTGIIQGFGIGIMFVPMTTVSFSTLPADLRADGTSFYTLSRNFGSSVGVAVSLAFIAHYTQVNHASITDHLVPTDQIYRSQALPPLLDMHGAAGLTLMNSEITRQAAAIAYLNNFRLMMWMTLLIIPPIFMFRVPRNNTAKPLEVKAASQATTQAAIE